MAWPVAWIESTLVVKDGLTLYRNKHRLQGGSKSTASMLLPKEEGLRLKKTYGTTALLMLKTSTG